MKKGEVVGVEAKTIKAKKVTVRAKAVILATGGFPGNQEMLKKYVPGHWQRRYGQNHAARSGD